MSLSMYLGKYHSKIDELLLSSIATFHFDGKQADRVGRPRRQTKFHIIYSRVMVRSGCSNIFLGMLKIVGH